MHNEAYRLKGGGYHNSTRGDLTHDFGILWGPEFKFYTMGFRCVYPLGDALLTPVCEIRGGSWYSGKDKCWYRTIGVHSARPSRQHSVLGARLVYPVEGESNG